MSITGFDRSVQYTGNGVADTFGLPFPYLSTDYLAVKINGILLTPGTDYEYVGTYPSESVRFIYWPLGVKTSNPPANGAAIDIQRYTPALQPTEFRNQGQYFAKTHEAAFDRLCMEIQDLSADAQLIITLNANLIYDFHTYYADIPGDGTVIGRWVSGRTVAFEVNLPGSKGAAKAAATGSTAFSIKKNGVQVGTCTFGAGATVATFAAGNAFGLTPGDVLSIEAPTPADVTLESISIVLIGKRVA